MLRQGEVNQVIDIIQPGYDSCPCGCGTETGYHPTTFRQKFAPGHDAKLVAKCLRLVREGQLTSNQALGWLEWEGYDKLAAKLARQLLHFPKNGPTMKAARQLLRDLDWHGTDDFWAARYVREICREHSAHCTHQDLQDCARTLVLNGWTKSKVCFRAS